MEAEIIVMQPIEQQIRTLHEEAQSLAFSYYLRKGRVPQRLKQIIAITSSPELFFKMNFNPDQPRVPAGSPEGGQWTNDAVGDAAGNTNGDSSASADDANGAELLLNFITLIVPYLRAPRIIASMLRYVRLGRNIEWGLGQFKSPKRWANQMESRGWTAEEITHTIKTGKKFPAPNNVNQGNTATRYENSETGKYLVMDDVTNEILQLGSKDFDRPLIPTKKMCCRKNHERN